MCLSSPTLRDSSHDVLTTIPNLPYTARQKAHPHFSKHEKRRDCFPCDRGRNTTVPVSKFSVCKCCAGRRATSQSIALLPLLYSCHCSPTNRRLGSPDFVMAGRNTRTKETQSFQHVVILPKESGEFCSQKILLIAGKRARPGKASSRFHASAFGDDDRLCRQYGLRKRDYQVPAAGEDKLESGTSIWWTEPVVSALLKVQICLNENFHVFLLVGCCERKR